MRLLQDETWPPSKFMPETICTLKKVEITAPSSKLVEGCTVAIEQQVIMQTASVQLKNLDVGSMESRARLLLDCGSQRTYISKYMAKN